MYVKCIFSLFLSILFFSPSALCRSSTTFVRANSQHWFAVRNTAGSVQTLGVEVAEQYVYGVLRGCKKDISLTVTPLENSDSEEPLINPNRIHSEELPIRACMYWPWKYGSWLDVTLGKGTDMVTFQRIDCSYEGKPNGDIVLAHDSGVKTTYVKGSEEQAKNLAEKNECDVVFQGNSPN
jgi:hypothetical protein